MSINSVNVSLVYGDGIGPHIMESVLKIMKATQVGINFNIANIGKENFSKGCPTGISNPAWDIIKNSNVMLKAPIETPQGKGYKSINVTIRRVMDLYINLRPIKTYNPFIPSTTSKNFDVTIIRENSEDLYTGIEHKHTNNVYQASKFITRRASEKIIRFAFEYAKHNNKKLVTCMTKDNIMKMTDGLFHSVFDEIAQEYPNIENNHYIIDIGSAKLAVVPENFDVVVTENLYGDIISDIVAEVSGSVGAQGSANLGKNFAMFEAVHGTAPDLASDKDKVLRANPTGLLQGAIMMLDYLAMYKESSLIYHSWLGSMKEGIHTDDIYKEGVSTQKASNQEFTDAICDRISTQLSSNVKMADDSKKVMNCLGEDKLWNINKKQENRDLVGVDIFVDYNEEVMNISAIADLCNKMIEDHQIKLGLKIIDVLGLAVWSAYGDLNAKNNIETDEVKLRFVSTNSNKIANYKLDIIQLISLLDEHKITINKTENLYLFDEKVSFSLSYDE